MPRGIKAGHEKKWNPEIIERELRNVAQTLGSFPTVSELRGMGLNNLVCAVTKAGGLMSWADRLGMPRKHSDSDTGWEGELAIQSKFESRGIACSRCDQVKSPYDLLAAGVLRVDVKAARFATYQRGGGLEASGWFYRIGKHVQADLVICHQLDTGSFYAIPWWDCPTGNISIGNGASKYAPYLNNWDLIDAMISERKKERLYILGLREEFVVEKSLAA